MNEKLNEEALRIKEYEHERIQIKSLNKGKYRDFYAQLLVF